MLLYRRSALLVTLFKLEKHGERSAQLLHKVIQQKKLLDKSEVRKKLLYYLTMNHLCLTKFLDFRVDGFAFNIPNPELQDVVIQSQTRV